MTTQQTSTVQVPGARTAPDASAKTDARSAAALPGRALPLGATPGGEQDVAPFRETVNQGGTPRPALFTVSGFLAEHAALNKDVVVVGAGDRLELWDRDRWNEHRPTLLGGVAEITARVDHPA